ncbi:MAG: ATP-binding cassette domain-containing protein, partial [Pseudomonadota bacterium]
MDKGLSLRNVSISKDGVLLLSVHHDVGPGEVLTIMGPSGVGKSTLLAYITGTLSSNFAAEGEVWLDGHNVTHAAPHQRRVGILFQDDLLFPHLSVGSNLAFGLQPGGTAAMRTAKIDEALEEVGLSGFADRDPATLSGGQKARVALMRMLLSEPCGLL